MRGTAIAAEGGENVTLQILQGRVSAVGFRSVADFPSKREKAVLPAARGSLSFSLFKGETIFAYNVHKAFRGPAPPRSSHSLQDYRYQTENKN